MIKKRKREQVINYCVVCKKAFEMDKKRRFTCSSSCSNELGRRDRMMRSRKSK